ncbi:MAG: site-2 protease family protein [Dehalococcoidales bacterium]|nr:site-2 protease family protein [Dehalococcoidales bacterium]
MIANILTCIIILGIIVFFHELGHFSVAKALNVRVDEFGIGYPPKIISTTKGETTYSLNWIPLGGFNRFNIDETGTDTRALNNQKPWKRLLIALAGSVATAILAYVIVFIALIVPHDIGISGGKMQVSAVVDDTPAAAAGLVPGDIILSANGIEISYDSRLEDAIAGRLDQENTITVKKNDGTIVDLTVIPRSNPPEGQGALGIMVQFIDYEIVKGSVPLLEAIPQSITTTNSFYTLFISAFAKVFSGEEPFDVAGPISIVQVTGAYLDMGFSTLLLFMALLCINLAVLNLLPIPGLDGGQVIISIIEWVRGKPLPETATRVINMIGFLCLAALMIFAISSDIGRLISGVRIIP